MQPHLALGMIRQSFPLVTLLLFHRKVLLRTDVDSNDFELANITPVIPTLDDTTGVNSDVAVDLSQPAIELESTAPRNRLSITTTYDVAGLGSNWRLRLRRSQH